MKEIPIYKIRFYLGASMIFVLSVVANAGTLTYNGGTWSAISGTASGSPSAYKVSNDVGGLSPSLLLTSPASGDNWTLSGTLTYSVLWTPASGTDTPPSMADVSWIGQGTLTVAGNGEAKISNATATLLEMDSTNNLLSGGTTAISSFDSDSTISLQPDGSYQATGTLVSDTLTSDYNSSTTAVTNCKENFTVVNITGIP